MLLLRVLGAVALLATTAVVTSGCFDDVYNLLEPCHSRDHYLLNYSNLSTDEVDTHLDGDYTLSTIDGRPIPSGGYVLPGRTDGKKLLTGKLHFNSTNTEYSGDCGKLLRSAGSVLAYYQTTTTNGGAKDDTYRGGNFTREHDLNTGSINAFKYTAPLIVAPAAARPSSITFAGLIDGITYTLKFTR